MLRGIDDVHGSGVGGFHATIEAKHVLFLMLCCCISWINALTSMPLFHIPIYNPVLPYVPLWVSLSISIRGILFIGALIWCDMRREEVSEQLVNWHQDWMNYRRVKNLNRRAKELSNKMKTKGLWGKFKLMRSEYMRTLHENQIIAQARMHGVRSLSLLDLSGSIFAL